MTVWNTIGGRGARGVAAGDWAGTRPGGGKVGLTAAGGAVLFGILFLWQIPHFLAIAWMYRAPTTPSGGLENASRCHDVGGKRTAFVMVFTAAAFGAVGVAWLRWRVWAAGSSRLVPPCAGVLFLRSHRRIACTRTDRKAKRVLHARCSTCRACSRF